MEAGGACIPYSRRPEWADIEPLPPPPGDAGKVVSIQYAERHAEALGYFRAILAKGEKTARALDLTRQLISFNGADYTAWQWRWQCVEALGADVEEEMALTERVAADSAKNYQLWNHRRKIAASRGPAAAADELAFADRALDLDEKNYHAWAHRQAVVAAAGCWQEELRYSEAMVERDVRNNSAWAQRAFVNLALLEQRQQQQCNGSSGGAGQQEQEHEQQQQQQVRQEPQGTQLEAAGATAGGAAQAAAAAAVRRRAAFLEMLPGEFEYVAAQLAVAPRNDSAWNYLCGLFSLPGATPHEMGRHKEVFIICREALADCPSCAPALGALAQYLLDLACLLWAAAAAAKQGGPACAADAGGIAARARDAASKALEVLSKAAVADPMRRQFLRHRVAEVEALVAELAKE